MKGCSARGLLSGNGRKLPHLAAGRVTLPRIPAYLGKLIKVSEESWGVGMANQDART